jgi:hypothetical protein
MHSEHLENPHKYTVYHLPRRRQLEMRRSAVVGIVVLGVALWVSWLVIPTSGDNLIYLAIYLLQAALYTPLMLLAVIFQWRGAPLTRLVISDQAIEYHTLGYSFVASPGAAVRIKKVRHGFKSLEVLVLKGAHFEGSKFWYWLNGRDAFGQRIPIGYFYGWREGEIGAALKHFAPHLFQPKTLPPEALPSSQVPMSRR